MNSTTSLVPQAAATGATPMAAPWKTYNEFFATNPEALKWGHYQTKELPGGELDRFYGPRGSTNPWRFSQEYNAYKNTLPREYQLLAAAGIQPSAVQSGAIKGIYDWGAGGKLLPVGAGTPEAKAKAAAGAGSQHALAPEVVNKMWR